MELVILVGILLFFLFRWLSKKYIKGERNRYIFIAIATPVTTFLFYCLLVYGVLFIITYTPEKEFDKRTWLSDTNKRYLMVDDLIKTKLLFDCDTSQVKQLIGEPSNRDSSNSQWEYNLGIGGGGLGFLFHFLNIRYENNKVIEVRHIEYMD